MGATAAIEQAIVLAVNVVDLSMSFGSTLCNLAGTSNDAVDEAMLDGISLLEVGGQQRHQRRGLQRRRPGHGVRLVQRQRDRRDRGAAFQGGRSAPALAAATRSGARSSPSRRTPDPTARRRRVRRHLRRLRRDQRRGTGGGGDRGGTQGPLAQRLLLHPRQRCPLPLRNDAPDGRRPAGERQHRWRAGWESTRLPRGPAADADVRRGGTRHAVPRAIDRPTISDSEHATTC